MAPTARRVNTRGRPATRRSTRVMSANNITTNIAAASNTSTTNRQQNDDSLFPTLGPITNLLPIFEGRESDSIKFFLNQITQMLDSIKLTDLQKTLILKSRLKGNAQEFLANNIELQQEKNYNKVKEVLENYYYTPKTNVQLCAEFNAIKQSPNMTVKQLAQKIKNTAQIYFNIKPDASEEHKSMIDNLLMNRFLDSLRSDLKWELRKLKILNFNDAITQAQRLEEAFNEQILHINNLTEQQNQNKILSEMNTQALITEARFQELAEQINNLRVAPQNAATYAPREIKKGLFCSHCKRQNHVYENCFYVKRQQNNERQQPTPKPNISCLACGKLNHLLSQCYFVRDLQKNLMGQNSQFDKSQTDNTRATSSQNDSHQKN